MRKLLSIIFLLGIISACTSNFEDLNTDKKHPLEVTGAVLFTNAEIALADQISSTNVNDNIFKLMAQYWTERSYRDEANYNLINRRIPDRMFKTYYSILKNLKDSKEIINAEVIVEPNLASKKANQANRLAIIDLMNAYVYQQLVDVFGNVPYSEALNSANYTPVYDDAQTIYKDLIAKAKLAVSTLDDSAGSFGTADLIYSGDVASWIKFGNSLLLKLGIGIADGPLSALGKSTVEAAFSNTFKALKEGAYFPYQESLPYVNPLYTDLVESGRHDFVMVKGMVDLMTAQADPRLDNYFENLSGVLTAYGASGGSYGNKVHYNEAIAAPDFHGILLTYDEIQFYLAEAAARGWNVGSSAEEYFKNGVTASIIEWGGTIAEANTFLTAHSFSSYSNWKEAIGTQAWVSMYTRGLEGYTFYRRLDYPTTLIMPPNPPTGVTKIPTRFTYPVNEQTLNAANYAAAATAMGGDLLTTKLFWDKY